MCVFVQKKETQMASMYPFHCSSQDCTYILPNKKKGEIFEIFNMIISHHFHSPQNRSNEVRGKKSDLLQCFEYLSLCYPLEDISPDPFADWKNEVREKTRSTPMS